MAETLYNTNTEIWIKNPIFSNLDLWIGAVQRFHLNKMKKIKVIHRGFYHEMEETYRNSPRWDLLDKFQLIYPEIPVICDPPGGLPKNKKKKFRRPGGGPNSVGKKHP